MSTTILSSMVIPMFVIFVCALFLIASRLRDIDTDLRNIRNDLVPKENPVLLFNNKNEPAKQREYWRDQNGFRHWRKTNNA